jgi:hypothetical protein
MPVVDAGESIGPVAGTGNQTCVVGVRAEPARFCQPLARLQADIWRHGHMVTFHGEVVYHTSTPPKPGIAFTLPADAD